MPDIRALRSETIRRTSRGAIEKQTDMYISMLRSHIEAMGGQLDVVARFPDGDVRISNFADLGVTDEQKVQDHLR
ncbi:hypothetical protein [Paraburkholderia sp.]|uniref:hypothetical protein n=1 Tax=Paraburkholderia sp. TaxID=1926495 RepID=UPI0025CD359F|nr:hypothetical protein [Paraburkholderia sp.]